MFVEREEVSRRRALAVKLISEIQHRWRGSPEAGHADL
jgi:hypothetical protein